MNNLKFMVLWSGIAFLSSLHAMEEEIVLKAEMAVWKVKNLPERLFETGRSELQNDHQHPKSRVAADFLYGRLGDILSRFEREPEREDNLSKRSDVVQYMLTVQGAVIPNTPKSVLYGDIKIETFPGADKQAVEHAARHIAQDWKRSFGVSETVIEVQ